MGLGHVWNFVTFWFLTWVLVSQMCSLGGNSARGRRNDLCVFPYVCFIKLTKIKKKCFAVVDRKITSTKCFFATEDLFEKKEGAAICAAKANPGPCAQMSGCLHTVKQTLREREVRTVELYYKRRILPVGFSRLHSV